MFFENSKSCYKLENREFEDGKLLDEELQQGNIRAIDIVCLLDLKVAHYATMIRGLCNGDQTVAFTNPLWSCSRTIMKLKHT